MDTIYKAKKLQARHSYKTRFLYSLIFHSFLGLTCILLCFYPSSSFPSLSSINTSLFLSLQHKISSLFSPTCMFILVNVIVAFLVGESKLVGSQSSTSTCEIYDGYVERSRSYRRVSTRQYKVSDEDQKLELDVMNEKSSTDIIQDKKVMVEDKQVSTEVLKKVDKPILQVDNEKKETNQEEEEEEEEDDAGLPAEELNKRVEEFIARVTKQRLLETKSLVCCEA